MRVSSFDMKTLKVKHTEKEGSMILDGSSEHVAPAFCDCTRSNQIPNKDQIREIAPEVRTHFC